MKNDIYIDANNRVLVWARESLAMSRNQAAERTGLSYKKLVTLEEGEKRPSLEELNALSKAYKRTIATLLLAEPPREKPLPADRRSVDSVKLGNFHEKSILAVRKARALAGSLVELKQEFNVIIPSFGARATLNDSAKSIAATLRSRWNLDEISTLSDTDYALEAYIEKIESLGVAVFQLSLTQDDLRGFSIVDDIIPIIGIKRGGERATSKIFTLFHEVGHIILNEGGMCDLNEFTNQQIEKWCNSFAAEMLIPTSRLLRTEIVLQQRGHPIWAKKDLIELGSIFHVGPLAVLRSLLENNLTTPSYYQEQHKAWNKPTFGRSKHPEGRNIPKETIKEKGRTYLSLAFSAFDQNRIDLKDLSDFLGIKLSYIPKTRQLLNA